MSVEGGAGRITGDALTFIDSHAHLADPAFETDRDAVVQAAAAAGAVGLVCIGESREAAQGALALADRYPGLVASTAGVHPHDAASYDPARDRDWILAAVRAGAVAVGECGLDYHYDNAPRDQQRAVFADQIELAASVGLPLVVHTRDAEPDTLSLLGEAGRARVLGVLHCFTGSCGLAEAALDLGWYVSFSGIVTFGKWQSDDVVRAVPADRLLVETDAPYLAPAPLRGRRNEPQFLPHTLSRLALVRGAPRTELAAATARNAERLFGLATRRSA